MSVSNCIESHQSAIFLIVTMFHGNRSCFRFIIKIICIPTRCALVEIQFPLQRIRQIFVYIIKQTEGTYRVSL